MSEKTTERLPKNYLLRYEELIKHLASKHYNATTIARIISEQDKNYTISVQVVYGFLKRYKINNLPY